MIVDKLDLGLLMLDTIDTHVKIVSFSFEFCRGVNLVRHYARDSLLHILHPFSHLVVAHIVHLLDEGIVLLPKGHLDESKGITELMKVGEL